MHYDDTFLARWIAGGLTQEELHAFEQDPDYNHYTKVLAAINGLQPITFNEDALLSKLKKQLYLEKQATAPSLSVSRRNANLFRWTSVAAACIGILLTAYFYFLPSDQKSIVVENAAKETLNFPDGSLAMVNSGSELGYSPSNWDKARDVNLAGEAYFEVKKGKKFRVLTAGGIVEVVGTKFNTRIREDGVLEVTCLEGMVNVLALNNNSFQALTQGQMARVKDSSVTLVEASKISKVEWMKNVSHFTDVNLSVIVAEFERQYNVKCDFPTINDYGKFDCSFPHQNISTAMKNIFGPRNLKYEHKNGVVSVSATPD